MSAQIEEKKKKQNKRKANGSIFLWILLIIVILLFVLTSIILGSRMYNLSTKEHYSVDLTMGDFDGMIELFNITYSGSSGEIVVVGSNGEKVVAPGTSVEYDVRLRNRDDTIIDFVMTPSVEYYTEDTIGVNFKVIDNYGNYVVGTEDVWGNVDDMNALAHNGTVHPGEVYTYHVTWQWDFDAGQNEKDTAFGNSSNSGIRVGFSTHASANTTSHKEPSHLMHLLGENFGCCWCCWLVWFLLLIILIMVLWIWRLRRTIRKLDQQVEEYEQMLKQQNGLLDV